MKTTINRGDAEARSEIEERPILMNGDMVRATLDGRKFQTRRVVKPQPSRMDQPWPKSDSHVTWHDVHAAPDYYAECGLCPYGKKGDRLIVKEAAWMWCERRPNGKTKTGRQKWLYVPMREAQVFYCAEYPAKPQIDVVSPDTGNQWGWRKKVGRFLPRWASGITLEIVSVRVEGVQDISYEEAQAEGLYLSKDGLWTWSDQVSGAANPGFAFELLWNSINEKRGFGWDKNPWVWVIGFRVLGQSHGTVRGSKAPRGKSKEEIK